MLKIIATIAAVIALGGLAGIGFTYSGIYYVGADQPHWSVTSWLLNEARTRSIKFHAAGIAVPTGLDDPAILLVGVTHFADHCAVCHGAPGIPQGDLAHGLYPRPPDLTAAAGSYTPGELFWIIKHGLKLSGMPAWGEHSDDEIWATVAFLAKLPGMTEEAYATLVASSRPHSGHHDEGRQSEPPTEPAPPPRESKHPHPPGHRH